MIVVQCLYCSNCKQTIYSRAHHDMRTCKCENCSIDGGREYLRTLQKLDLPLGAVLRKSVAVEATEQELYDDWNLGTDKFGVIEDDC